MKDTLAIRDSRVSPTVHDRVCVRIADITYGIVSVDPGLNLCVTQQHEEFRVEESSPDVLLETRWDDLSDRDLKGAAVFQSGSVWNLYRDGDDFVFTLSAPSLGPAPYKVARIQKDFRSGEVRLHRPYYNTDEPVYPLEYPLDELLVIHYLGLGNGVELHATGIADASNRGHLFVGQSGAGKTTMARLWENRPGATVLSDDRMVVRTLDGRIWMYGTPWHGEARLSSPARVPLYAVYLLRHEETNIRRPLAPAEAAGRLFACCFPPFHDAAALEATLACLDTIVRGVPCHELAFRPDAQVVEFLGAART